jgi:hypothetical protein
MGLQHTFGFNQNYAVTAAPAPANTYVTGGLVLYWDASVLASYPGSGSTITDLSGNSNNGTLVNGVAYTTSPVPTLAFTASANQYVSGPSTGNSFLDTAGSNFTYIGLARYTDTTGNGRTLSARNNWLIGGWSNSTENFFAGGVSVVTLGTGTNDTNWRYYHGTGNTTTGFYSFYINNIFKASVTSSGGAGPASISLNSQFNGSAEFSDSQIPFVLLYNRVLTDAERTQNYDYFKSKFSVIT